MLTKIYDLQQVFFSRVLKKLSESGWQDQSNVEVGVPILAMICRIAYD